MRNGSAGHKKIANRPQFLTIEPRFVRKGFISWRLVGTAPRLKRDIEKKEREEGKRARGQKSKRAREQEGKKARGQGSKRERGQEGKRARGQEGKREKM